MKTWKIAAYISLVVSSCTLLASTSNVQSEKEIKQVVEAFKAAIINQDQEAFKALFYKNDIPFIAVFSDEMLEKKRATNPEYPSSVDFGRFGSPIEQMISEEDEQEEKMWDLTIHADDYLGSVHFQYSDHFNGKIRAWGTESWSLIKEGENWKITSVSFTVTEAEEE